VNSATPNASTPGVAAGAFGSSGAKEAIAANAATRTAAAMPAALHFRSSERTASSRRRSVSMTVNSTRTETAPA